MIANLQPSSYLQLPPDLYQITLATAVNNPAFAWLNYDLASRLGIPDLYLNSSANLRLLAGNEMSSNHQSLALVYSGHQFGNYVPQLGDGRALMLGELLDAQHRRWDVQLKGAGPTKYSRQGDGRCPLDAALREAIFSTAMHRLGISSTQTLAVITSDTIIDRPFGPIPAGIVTRIAQGHLRVGSFQFAATLTNPSHLKALADYAISRHYPAANHSQQPYISFFTEVLDKQAQLIAHWMGVGFIHGVMNTDNSSICGETLDYGPCAFIDDFSWTKVFSSIDTQGRYAYQNQADIAYWNCMQFSQSLKPLIDPQQWPLLEKALHSFPTRFQAYWLGSLGAKFGLLTLSKDDAAFIQVFFKLMQETKADFTNSFRHLNNALILPSGGLRLCRQLGGTHTAQRWVDEWYKRVELQNIDEPKIISKMNQANPVYIPRNHIVGKAIHQYIYAQDETLLQTLMQALQNPYEERKEFELIHRLPSMHEKVEQTFCGT